MNVTSPPTTDFGRSLEIPRSLVRCAKRVSKTSLFMAETRLHAASEAYDEASPIERAMHCAWVAENLCALHGIEVVERGARPARAAIYVANHVSYIEPIALLAKVPGTAIAKREVGSWPVIGDAVRALGMLLVDRARPASGASVLREAWRRLDEGVSLVVFPEGTTTHGRDVLPFRRGAFGLGRLADVPIVPVAVRFEDPEAAWVGDDSFAPHYLRTTSRPLTRVFLDYLEPIDARHSDLDAAALGELARRRIRARLAA